jgi:hypothetical protein
MRNRQVLLTLCALSFALACSDGSTAAAPGAIPKDPGSAPRTTIDRFSSAAGMLMVRDDSNGLPEAGMPIDYDQPPFITQGLGPAGEVVRYYNFDVQPTAPAPIYVLFREGEDAPVDEQLNIVDVVPGDDGYNDFWRVTKVTVPDDYVANTITSYDEIGEMDLETETTDMLVNCPIVPRGSTATLRYGNEDPGLTLGWYEGEIVYYFNFSERALSGSAVPTSPIYVTFNINPDQEGGGPGSGFVTEADSEQTHNVVATVPDQSAYSPLWSVNPYDNADFDDVVDLDSVLAANVLATGVANVNCPIVEVEN